MNDDVEPTGAACYVLTDLGTAFCDRIAAACGRLPAAALKTPAWDARRRELWYAGRLIRCFRRAAWNQMLVLAAFQEENWRQGIDDPLPYSSQRKRFLTRS